MKRKDATLILERSSGSGDYRFHSPLSDGECEAIKALYRSPDRACLRICKDTHHVMPGILAELEAEQEPPATIGGETYTRGARCPRTASRTGGPR